MKVHAIISEIDLYLNKALYGLMICYCPISTNLEQKGLCVWKKSLLT